MTLTQTGTKATGNMTVTGTPVDRSGAVTMLVSGNDVYLVYPTGITGYLVVSGDEMKGELDGNSTGLRVISVDYTLAPHAKYNQMSDEVVAAIKDASMLQSLADAAYRDVALDPRWSYEAFTRRFDDALQVAHGAKRQALRPKVSRLGFAAVSLPAALLALLLRLWLSVPNGLRAQLRPAIRPLVAALRR